MKLLVDENLPPRLVENLTDLFPDSVHVRSVGLGGTADSTIWEYAKAHGFTFMTRDKDFANLSMTWGAPPRVILLQVGNCSTSMLSSIVRKNAIRFSEFENDTNRSLLILR